MYLGRSSVRLRWLRDGVFVLVLIILSGANSSCTPFKAPTVTTSMPLPGQQHWKDDVSSFLFGTNDTYEYSPKNIETEQSIQQLLRSAGFTLIRSFFPDHAKDIDIERRIEAIENSGAHCLGVITNIRDATFDEHLVRYLGNRCLLYEFGNELDIHGFSIEEYLKQWNSMIPLLRAINPHAKFIGPVTHNERGNLNFMQAFLQGVKESRVLPDAVSFHWYACYQDAEDACLSKASDYEQVAIEVRQLVQTILGKDLPVGITEWNYDPENPPPAYGDQANFIINFSTNALRSMAEADVSFACQFDAASYAGYGHLDMFDVKDNQPKPQYYAIKDLIQEYRPSTIRS